ncbi:hypothetical protein EWG10_10700 [Salmonella enterica subsp. enterica serovar Napoli]|uniref:Uncharacterized protein n=1 Tax=Salmonella enterica subsp. enterica serovar Napoli TaxID=1151001 RepID=A0A5I0FI28_SALET|nr:hypothetical protein [Salmonella enterica subsp. enterica serovar Napoli]EAB3380909.1 hypothetical protein [Salmonella enterica]EAC0523050.1 hypothetical protein [Salmonella enterica subsp. enterica serovar Zaiman]ECF7021760.1 hypothetical protein [Salmonella enterica subsp. enterica]ECS8048559.1 hypothetical protein [Salmonella enterica subsp. enterica serovar Mississippi]
MTGVSDKYAGSRFACDGPSGRGPWMGRVIRSQHISNLKYEGDIKKGRLRGPLDYGGDRQRLFLAFNPLAVDEER